MVLCTCIVVEMSGAATYSRGDYGHTRGNLNYGHVRDDPNVQGRNDANAQHTHVYVVHRSSEHPGVL